MRIVKIRPFGPIRLSFPGGNFPVTKKARHKKTHERNWQGI